jgi:hypothetical protein
MLDPLAGLALSRLTRSEVTLLMLVVPHKTLNSLSTFVCMVLIWDQLQMIGDGQGSRSSAHNAHALEARGGESPWSTSVVSTNVNSLFPRFCHAVLLTQNGFARPPLTQPHA